MMKYMYYSVRNVIKHTKVNFKSENYIALLLFILFSWGGGIKFLELSYAAY